MPPPLSYRKPAAITMVIIAAVGCLALGWWQWTRFESTSGSFQNLGYALQWPMFAVFCVYAYRTLTRYQHAGSEPQTNTTTVTEIPAGLLPERPTITTVPDIAGPEDQVLHEYNNYLAELAAESDLTTE